MYSRVNIGIAGYARSRSVPSLVAGVGVGAMFGAASYLIKENRYYGHETGVVASAIMASSMLPKAMKTRKPFPVILAMIGTEIVCKTKAVILKVEFLGLSAQDRSVYRELFSIADTEKKSFLMKKEAMAFFSNTGIPRAFLEEIWKTVDGDQKDYITEVEFYVALKLIACAQNGVETNDDILSTQAQRTVPVPKFKGVAMPGAQPTMEIAPITANEREAYIEVFNSCNPIDGLLYSEQTINIFNRSNLPSKRLAEIWALADTRNSGTLNKTEFIIAMHYVSRLRKNPVAVLPPTLPSQVYAEAAGRFASSIRRHDTTVVNRSRASSNTSLTAGYTTPIISHMMTEPVAATANTTTGDIVLGPEEKEKYQTYFNQLDTDESGFIEGQEAVYFFSHSQLPNSELGRIWEIADSRHIGKLDLHDFCIAMHLINMRKRGESIDKYQSTASLQTTPFIQHQTASQTQAELNRLYELENLAIELKQQINYEAKRNTEYQRQQKQEREYVEQLKVDIRALESELTAAKKAAEDAEKTLEIEQKRNRELTGVSILENSYSSAQQSVDSPSAVNVPELTRVPSLFSGNSSVISPRSDFATTFDPFAGIKKMNQESNSQQQKGPPLSPTQRKAILKYGFDITAFDVLSVENSSASQEQMLSVEDDLAALFGSLTTVAASVTKSDDDTPTFDSIFM
ncbi:hypothetical protein [Parasitella parasitica]|uniref:Uncharacterized protein n=1 Tax=Parasitella parasitica TaxID=35722 RepID=A0A0B7N0B4_9FUNG|nr:hypothetical protein [Parasitella parasitica]